VQVFGEARLRDGSLQVSSTKGATGHLLGAAGAVEAAFTVLAAHHRQVPATTNLEEPDDPAMLSLLRHGRKGELQKRAVCMCNSFGFGGVNTSLVVSSVEGPVSWDHYI
jgi:3-oxoacyl-[acyl-carrier-protein] synthase II